MGTGRPVYECLKTPFALRGEKGFLRYDARGVVMLCGIEKVFIIMTVSVKTVECDGWNLCISAMWQG